MTRTPLQVTLVSNPICRTVCIHLSLTFSQLIICSSLLFLDWYKAVWSKAARGGGVHFILNFLFIIHYWGKSGQKFKVRTWNRNSEKKLLAFLLSCLFSGFWQTQKPHSQTHSELGPPTKIFRQGNVHRTIWRRQFISWNSLFSGDSKLTLKCNQHKNQSFENLNRRDKNNGEPVYFSFLTLSLFLSLFEQRVWLLLVMLSLTLRFLFRLWYSEFAISNSSSLGPFYQKPRETLTSEGCVNYLPDSDDYSFIDWAVLLVVAWNFLDSHCVKQSSKCPCLCPCYSFFFQELLPCE